MDEQNEQTNPQPPNDDNPPQSDDTNLRELALALLMARYPYAAEGEEPQLLPEQLPPNFPGDIPLPPGSRVVGSLAADSPIVVLDTNQAAEAVVTFYEERLSALGWVMPEPIMPEQHGGFLDSGRVHIGRMPRQGAALYRDDGPSLQIAAYKAGNGRTRVQLTLTPHGARELRRSRRGMAYHYEIYSLLPPIEPPPNTQQSQGGGSVGSDHIDVEGRIESDLDLSTLATHYTAELERGGWQRTGGAENDPVAWSTWTFVDEEKEPWRALFVILKRPDAPKTSWLHIVADWTGSQAQGGRGIAYTGELLGSQAHHPPKP